MSDRLISADKAKEVLKHLLYETAMNNELDIADIYEDIIENRLDTWIELIPTADAEPTEEQVKEYCRKRCLVIVNSELFNEMKARWSSESVGQGHWTNHLREDGATDGTFCSQCDGEIDRDSRPNYCPNCGVKMDEHIDTPTDPVAK